MTRDECILLGTIAKTHGVHGGLILRTADPSYDLKENRESIFLLIDGILVPFFISSLKPFRAGEWILTVDWYESRDRAEKLAGYEAWVPRETIEEPSDGIYLDELIGYEIFDKPSSGKGTITAFLDVSENPLFEAVIGGEKLLIPAREEFILEVDPDKKRIILELPEGLL
jgi:16S rRNA processing protein RimM